MCADLHVVFELPWIRHVCPELNPVGACELCCDESTTQMVLALLMQAAAAGFMSQAVICNADFACLQGQGWASLGTGEFMLQHSALDERDDIGL